MLQHLLGNLADTQIIVLGFCALMVGITKTGLPGLGILAVPVMAMAFPARLSTGMLLLMLAAADLFAVAYYRRHANWHHILRLLPWALFGIAAGSVVIRYVNDENLRPVIGIIILLLLGVNYWRSRNPDLYSHIPHHWGFAAVLGFTAGLTTQIANAAGPVMAIYLLAMQLPKNEYIGTGAWYFLILNWLKIVLFVWDGRITMAAVKADVAMLPLLLLGAVAGIVILKKIPQQWFERIVQILALLAALKLTWTITELI
jgi:uncharacterized membrane protein YfcA